MATTELLDVSIPAGEDSEPEGPWTLLDTEQVTIRDISPADRDGDTPDHAKIRGDDLVEVRFDNGLVQLMAGEDYAARSEYLLAGTDERGEFRRVLSVAITRLARGAIDELLEDIPEALLAALPRKLEKLARDRLRRREHELAEELCLDFVRP